MLWRRSKYRTTNYVDPGLTLAIDFKAYWNKFKVIKSGKRFSSYQFLCLKERDIIDIIKNEDYD